MGTRTRVLLRRVDLRLRAALVAGRFHAFFLALAAGYGALLICSRLLALVPDHSAPLHVVTLVAAALALALAFYRRPRPADAARLVDRCVGTDDLFLTATLIDGSAGHYQSLVLRSAEERAASVRPARVLPARGRAAMRNVLLAAGLLLVGMLYLPQLDPFGREARWEAEQERRLELEATRKATDARIAALLSNADAELSDRVHRSVEELTQSFKGLKAGDKQSKLQRLREHQAALGKLWRDVRRTKLNNSFRTAAARQRFGQGEGGERVEWRQDGRAGRPDSMKQHVAALKETLRKMEATRDPVEQRRLATKMRDDLDKLREFASNDLEAKALEAALQRAMEQLSMCQCGNMASSALQALGESLDLTELELDALAQALQDLEALEQALNAAQLARLAEELGLTDEMDWSECQTLAEYEALYRKLMEGRCPCCGAALGTCACSGRGPGTGGQGQGMGGIVPEDPTAETDFKSEKSRSALQAGKILLSLKVQGDAPRGRAVVDYREQVGRIRESVSEAVVHEQIPPAYHEAIQKYFDSMEDSYAGSTGE